MDVSIRGLRIHVEEGEEGRNVREPSLLFLHGAGGDAAIWDLQAGFFRGKRSVYRFELPGHGLSTGAGEDGIAEYTQWVHAAIRDGLPPHEWVAVGHSMGGAIALQLALEKVSGLMGMVLVGTGAKLGVLPAILQMLEKDPEAFFKAIDMTAFCSDTPAEVREISSRSIRRCPPAVTLKDFKACDRFDVRSRLQEIAIPTLILCGQNDRLTPPKYSELLHQGIRSSRLVVIPDAGHMLMAEKPEPFNQAVQAFLEELTVADWSCAA